MSPWQVNIYENGQLLHSAQRSGPLELGRQDEGEPGPYTQRMLTGRYRLIIARREEQTISRRHVLLEECPDGRVRVTNLSTTQPVHLPGGGEVRPGAEAELALPLDLTVGPKAVRVRESDPEETTLRCLPEGTQAPAAGDPTTMSLFPTLAAPSVGSGEGRALVHWLRSAMGVFQSAASSSDFFAQAARAVVSMAGLDSGRVLLFDGAGWQTRALYAEPRLSREAPPEPSRIILTKVREEKKTFWELPGGSSSASLVGVTAVVAAPILDRNGDVIGALYGDRRQRSGLGGAEPITELQALLVELLASGVAAGLARLEQEQAAVAARVRFEQFFTPELARRLDEDPDLLSGRDADVTVMFADIWDFSRLSEHLPGPRTVEWVNDVLGALSECVLAERGVLVEYIGDELMAMWGAPVPLPDHAARACRAALAMTGRVAQLNERWESVLGGPMRLGIGINSGPARVGMIGSQYKFKYGPLGPTANLASRVQGATRYFKARVLLTRATREPLGPEFALRRVCRVRVVNVAEPVDLYELGAEAGSGWQSCRADYERALERFEKRSFGTAVRILGNILNEHPEDGPSLVLMARAVTYLMPRPPAFDPVWELPGK
jgi:adenylate cyclase